MSSSPPPKVDVQLRATSPPPDQPATPALHRSDPPATELTTAIEHIPEHSPPGCTVFASAPSPCVSAPLAHDAAPRRKRKRRSPCKPDAKMPRLTQPLSELTKDFRDHAVKDMAQWVNRPAAVRRSESSKRNGFVTRPMNSFFLYRLAYADRTKAWCLRNDHTVISAVSGQSWPLEPPHIREKYIELARLERRNHRETYPDYKFSPSPKETPMLPPKCEVRLEDVGVEDRVCGVIADGVGGDGDAHGGVVGVGDPARLDGPRAGHVNDYADGGPWDGENRTDAGGVVDDLQGVNYEFDAANYFFDLGDQDAYGVDDKYDYDSDATPFAGSHWDNLVRDPRSANTSPSPFYPMLSDGVSPGCVHPSSARLDPYRFEYQEADLLLYEYVHASEVEIAEMYTAAWDNRTAEGCCGGTIVVRYTREDVWGEY